MIPVNMKNRLILTTGCLVALLCWPLRAQDTGQGPEEVFRRVSRDLTIPFEGGRTVCEPVFTARTGETIIIETINHMTPVVTGVEDLHKHNSPLYREREETGPVAVEGARPGDMLKVDILDISVVGIPHAFSMGPIGNRFEMEPLLFPLADDRLKLPGGISIPYKPSVSGIYTMNSAPVHWDNGGIMGFAEIRPGCTIYMPVAEEGGLLVMGDVHAAQGDGEIFGEGAETAADITVRISVDTTVSLDRPLIETEDAFITLAKREDVYESAKLAVSDMTGFISRKFHIPEYDAYIYSMMTGSLRFGSCLANRHWHADHFLVGFSVPKEISLDQK